MRKSRSLNASCPMNTTDGALAWLLSLSATCNDDDAFTDWLPTSSSPFHTSSSSSSQDVFFHSTIVNSPSPLYSPALDYLNLYDPSLALPSLPFSDVSPVIRASHKSSDPDKENQPPKKRKNKSSSSFLEKLHSATPILPTIQHPPASPAAHLPTKLDLLEGSSQTNLVLLSPVKIPSPSLHVSPVPQPVFTTPPRPTNAFLSPLSPLTPLSSPEPLKIKISLKRKNPDPTTPIRKTKRPRRTCTLPVQPDPVDQDQHTDDEGSPPAQDDIPRSVYTNRTLPTDIEISSAFPLLYRRFPASTYYQPPDEE